MACICQGRARRRSKPPPPPQSTPPGRTCKAAACSDTSMAAFVARSSARSLSALARACPALCTSWEAHARTRCRTVTRACRAPATCRFTQRLFHPTPFSPNAFFTQRRVCARVLRRCSARGAWLSASRARGWTPVAVRCARPHDCSPTVPARCAAAPPRSWPSPHRSSRAAAPGPPRLRRPAAPPPPIDAPCAHCLRHGDPMHAKIRLTAAAARRRSSSSCMRSERWRHACEPHRKRRWARSGVGCVSKHGSQPQCTCIGSPCLRQRVHGAPIARRTCAPPPAFRAPPARWRWRCSLASSEPAASRCCSARCLRRSSSPCAVSPSRLRPAACAARSRARAPNAAAAASRSSATAACGHDPRAAPAPCTR
jgi:hypothetical protein